MTTDQNVRQAYLLAQERYAELGVDSEHAINQLGAIALSLHCWQGDDVGGFEHSGAALGGGLAATGNYPGKARSADELRLDLDQAYRLIPGSHRLNLHAMYAETGAKRVERNQLEAEHFKNWVDWAKDGKHGLDFNPSLFSHAMAADGMTLSHADASVRQFWIEHCIACRKIGAYFGEELDNACVTNIWIPDGSKDTPYDRKSPRERLRDALDVVLKEKIDPRFNLDAVEPKLFGIGAESYTTGSSEFYLGYAVSRQVLLTLDSGHFHPTETISDKLSAVLLYLPEVLLHVSRGVRWDSDHVVTFGDDLQAICQEVVRGGYLQRVHIGLDYFDASINRIAAWVIGSRATLKALLMALLEPGARLAAMENSADFSGRLALMEEAKGLPFAAVWDYYCLSQGVPVGAAFLDDIRAYEKDVLSRRG